MKPSDNHRPQSLAAVEDLLREAAAWEPDGPAPEGLALLALERCRPQRGAAPGRRVAVFAGASLAAGAACATVALAVAQVRPPQPVVGALLRPAPLMAHKEVDPPPQVVTSDNHSTPAAKPAGQAKARTRLRRGARFAARRRAPAAGIEEAPVPKVRWLVETVQAPAERVVAPGWLVEPGPDEGTVIVTPGVLDAVVESATACEPLPEPQTNESPPAPADSAAPSELPDLLDEQERK